MAAECRGTLTPLHSKFVITQIIADLPIRGVSKLSAVSLGTTVSDVTNEEELQRNMHRSVLTGQLCEGGSGSVKQQS